MMAFLPLALRKEARSDSLGIGRQDAIPTVIGERADPSFVLREDRIMSNIGSLSSRIDAAFSAVEEKMKKFQSEQMEEYKQRQNRLEQLSSLFERLRVVWEPRLELLVQKFAGQVNMTPRIVASTREVTFSFQSRLASVRLKFAAGTDQSVHKLILSYDLEIIPVLIRFQPHYEVEFPLNAVDPEAVARWMDDRIVEFVETYFSLGENDIYLKDQMVEDPVAHVRFPRIAAATSLDWQGQTFYFIGEETRHEFEQQQGIGSR